MPSNIINNNAAVRCNVAVRNNESKAPSDSVLDRCASIKNSPKEFFANLNNIMTQLSLEPDDPKLLEKYQFALMGFTMPENEAVKAS